MIEEKNVTETKKNGWAISDIIKIISAFAVTIPLFLGYFQYQRSVQQDIDNNFRNLVEKLSSEKKENRLAGATNLGTIILNEGEYYDAAIDILINAIAIEHDINILNAIRGSLEKVKIEDYKNVIQQLLNLERNSFIYEHPLKTFEKNEELKELTEQRALVTNFIALILTKTRNNPIEDLMFYQNSLNELVLMDINLVKSSFENSALSLSIISNTNFNNSKITNTVFTYSSFDNCSFSDCEINSTLFDQLPLLKDTYFRGSTFKDVFFAGSDLAGSDFTGVKGLQPVYFFKANNLDKAKFDDDFRKELEILYTMSVDEYINYINNSTLTIQRMSDIYKAIE